MAWTGWWRWVVEWSGQGSPHTPSPREARGIASGTASAAVTLQPPMRVAPPSHQRSHKLVGGRAGVRLADGRVGAACQWTTTIMGDYFGRPPDYCWMSSTAVERAGRRHGALLEERRAGSSDVHDAARRDLVAGARSWN